jgi:transcriptional antiterminator RfaH
MEHWYTLYTKPNAEYQVMDSLQKRGVQTYLPEIESHRTPAGRKKKPFFPCYLFIKVDFDRVGLSRVQWTPGLRRIVAFDSRPVPLPDEVIDLIRSKLGETDATGDSSAHTFHQGDRLRVTEGPLQGMLAIFEGPSTAAQRVRVLLDILGHASRAWIPVTGLEKAPPDAEAPAPKRPRRTRGRGRRIKK